MGTILLLEDNYDLSVVLQQILEFQGHKVMLGRNGEDGVDLLTKAGHTPDLIICDLHMPHMDGIEFLKELRHNTTWSKTHLVIMSGNMLDKAYVMDAGADDFISKPFNMGELNHILIKWGLQSND